MGFWNEVDTLSGTAGGGVLGDRVGTMMKPGRPVTGCVGSGVDGEGECFIVGASVGDAEIEGTPECSIDGGKDSEGKIEWRLDGEDVGALDKVWEGSSVGCFVGAKETVGPIECE